MEFEVYLGVTIKLTKYAYQNVAVFKLFSKKISAMYQPILFNNYVLLNEVSSHTIQIKKHLYKFVVVK